MDTGHPEQAEAVFRENYAYDLKHPAAGKPIEFPQSLTNLNQSLAAQHKPVQAPVPGMADRGKADGLMSRKEFPAAEALLRTIVEQDRAAGLIGRTYLAIDLVELGDSLQKQRLYAQAEVPFREGMGILQADLSATDPIRVNSDRRFGGLLMKLDKTDEAIKMYREAIAADNDPSTKTDLYWATNDAMDLAAAFEKAGDLHSAEAELRSALKARQSFGKWGHTGDATVVTARAVGGDSGEGESTRRGGEHSRRCGNRPQHPIESRRDRGHGQPQ